MQQDVLVLLLFSIIIFQIKVKQVSLFKFVFYDTTLH